MPTVLFSGSFTVALFKVCSAGLSCVFCGEARACYLERVLTAHRLAEAALVSQTGSCAGAGHAVCSQMILGINTMFASFIRGQS